MPDVVLFVVNQKSKQGIKIAHRLEKHLPQTSSVLHLQTNSPEEAVAEVREAVGRYAKPLIVSVSGDGGTQLVNEAAYKAKLELGGDPTVASVAAGGVNDHAQCVLPVKLKDLPAVIEAGNTAELDLIRVILTLPDGTVIEIIVSSYCGFKITAVVAEAVNQMAKRSFVREASASLSGAVHVEPFRIEVGGEVKNLANLTFHNIPRMARILRIAPEAKFDDGVIEMLQVPHGRFDTGKVLSRAVRAAFARSHPEQVHEPVRFQLLDAAPFQFDGDTRLDGELVDLPPGTKVEVSCIPGAIKTLVP